DGSCVGELSKVPPCEPAQHQQDNQNLCGLAVPVSMGRAEDSCCEANGLVDHLLSQSAMEQRRHSLICTPCASVARVHGEHRALRGPDYRPQNGGEICTPQLPPVPWLLPVLWVLNRRTCAAHRPNPMF